MTARKPWPMKAIVLLMILFIVPYTYLTLRYRKPGSVPIYQDVRERINDAQAGYQKRVTLRVTRPADDHTVPSAVRAAPGGLPPDLRATFVAPPVLPEQIGAVAASALADSTQPYTIQFDCTLADRTAQPASAHLYVKGDRIVVVTDFEILPNGLSARTRSGVVRLTVPPAALDPGKYLLTLVGGTGSKTWALQVH